MRFGNYNTRIRDDGTDGVYILFYSLFNFIFYVIRFMTKCKPKRINRIFGIVNDT